AAPATPNPFDSVLIDCSCFAVQSRPAFAASCVALPSAFIWLIAPDTSARIRQLIVLSAISGLLLHVPAPFGAETPGSSEPSAPLKELPGGTTGRGPRGWGPPLPRPPDGPRSGRASAEVTGPAWRVRRSRTRCRAARRARAGTSGRRRRAMRRLGRQL